MRVVLLRSDDAHHAYLENLLLNCVDLRAVVIEPGRSQLRQRMRGRRYVDCLFMVYHQLRRRLTGLDAYRRRYFYVHQQCAVRVVERTIVESVNAAAVVDTLRRHQPEVTVVICTSIIGRRVLEAANVAINIHGGVLPFYRGNFCFFWALYNQDFKNIGSTIHFVDEGIDTGDIIEIVHPPLHRGDTAETLYCRSEMLAFSRLLILLSNYEKGVPFPRKPQINRTRLYRTRDRGPWHDILMMIRHRSVGSQFETNDYGV